MMESTTLESADQLVAFFEDVGVRVGSRTGPDKRTQAQKELYNLRQFLTTSAANGQLEFPLRIEMAKPGESPDFMLAVGGRDLWGLEVTEATTQGWQRELTETELNEESSEALLLDSPGGGGWVGNGPERETCAAILRAMRRKARKIRSGKYRPASRYDVLIYVSVRAFCYRAQETIDLLTDRTARWSSQWDGVGARHYIVVPLQRCYEIGKPVPVSRR